MRTISEGLRQEAGPDLRVTIISPGFVADRLRRRGRQPRAPRDRCSRRATSSRSPPEAIARAMAYAIAEPSDVDVGEVVVRPTAQA